MDMYIPCDKETIQKHVVKHIEYDLARTRFSMDNSVWYQAIARSVRDRLIEAGNDTRKVFLASGNKRVYYFSLEYLPGRSLKNALVNLDLEQNYKEALDDLGENLEELYEEEQDPGIGNGGLGRLASCFLDSAATHNLPVWGYGLRYNYGIFKQKIVDGAQCEMPDYWLMEGFPWEVRRSDVVHKVQFYGKVTRENKDGKEKVKWEEGEVVNALAYDLLIPGFNTFNTITLRLWGSMPTQEFDFERFNLGDYYDSVKSKQRAEFITSVLYPNDSTVKGKKLRLAQEYFFVSASLQDLLWRFRVVNKNWDDLPSQIAIQLNDTHPALGIIELLRILVDEEEFQMDHAWELVTKTFSYTNHTVLPEALEKWSEDLLQEMLPRHLELIHLVNHRFLEQVKAKFANDPDKLSSMSIVEETTPKMISMAHLSIIGSHTVNGVSAVHSDLLKTDLFKNFYEIFPDKFQNKTNGVTHRRWIACANPDLGQLYTDQLGTKDWLTNLELIKPLIEKLDDAEFREKWNDIKQKNKRRLISWIHKKTGVTLKEESMSDVQVKRIHEYKRQFMNAFYVVYRYLQLKEASPEERKAIVPRSVLIGGKSAPGYVNAKRIIRLILAIAKVINEDPDTKDYLNLIFLPNYSVTSAEVIIPAADVCQQISTAGTEASGTSNMKFCMNGAMILGTMDGANIEIAEEVGMDNIVTFGASVEEVDEIRTKMLKGDKLEKHEEAEKVLEAIEGGMFGNDKEIMELIETVKDHNDRYLVSYDFKAYIEAQEKMDELYKDRENWTKKSIINALKSSKFSSDRTIQEYAKEIWDIKTVTVLSPTTTNASKDGVCKLTCDFDCNATFGKRTKSKHED